jgi:hypothetical protein
MGASTRKIVGNGIIVGGAVIVGDLTVSGFGSTPSPDIRGEYFITGTHASRNTYSAVTPAGTMILWYDATPHSWILSAVAVGGDYSGSVYWGLLTFSNSAAGIYTPHGGGTGNVSAAIP